MAQRCDVSLKSLFQRDGDGIIRRLLFGGKGTEFLATEQPQVRNRRANMMVRNEEGALRQVEFQSQNDGTLGGRLPEYYIYAIGVYDEHVEQTVLYIGREPLRMKGSYQTPSIDFRFQIINLREMDAGPLLASDDWADNALALLARGSPEKALEAVLPKLQAMTGDDRSWAAGTLVMLSGILRIEEVVNHRLREVGMIDLMENKVFTPILEERYERGREQGREEVREEVLHELLTIKFGDLPKMGDRAFGQSLLRRTAPLDPAHTLRCVFRRYPGLIEGTLTLTDPTSPPTPRPLHPAAFVPTARHRPSNAQSR